jgi:putative transposase
MVLRWAAAGFVETEKNYRRIMGYQQLWMLKAALDESLEDPSFASQRKCG